MRQWLGDDVSFRTIEEFAGDLVRGRRPFNYMADTTEGRERYSRFLAQIPDSLKENAKALRSEFQKMPTEYFELKPQRGVSLSEFKGAIVPEKMQKRLIKILKDSGIKKIFKYGSPEERKALFKKFPELMFALPPTIAGMSLLEDRE